MDEFADIKSVKLLRRGRRLQEVEQVYGKNPAKGTASSSSSSLSSLSDHPRRQTVIPQLDAKFFASPFFARFDIQHSLLDPGEFASRYVAHIKGGSTLSVEGQLLAKVLVVWAASFGVDESGIEVARCSGTGITTNWRHEAGPEGAERRARRERTDTMTQELLHLVDLHGILRKPTWDGVRVLLLIWPLTLGVQTALQRITMYESTLSQIYALCSVENPSPVRSGQSPYSDALIRARIFWYAHVNEGTTNALRGGRLVLNDDDLVAFQQTLPSTSPRPSSSLPSPVSPTCPADTQTSSDATHPDASLFLLMTRYFSLTLNLSSVCRRIHVVLTGPKARQSPVDSLDENGLRDVWEGLERCWDDFEAVRRTGLSAGGISIGTMDIDRFVSSWQVFIFECHNIIREALKQRVVSTSSPALSSKPFPSSSSSASSTPSPDSALLLHAHATRKCRAILPRLLSILRRHLSMPSNGFFAYDAGLVKDGCFFAGFMLAQGDFEEEGHSLELGMDVEDGVEVCLHALGAMEWVFSKSDERQQTVRMMWDARKMREAEHRRSRHAYARAGDEYDPQGGSRDSRSPFHQNPGYPGDQSSYVSRLLHPCRVQPVGAQTLPVPPTLTHRPLLAPLSLSPTNLRVHSAPSTACTDTGSWPTYTPPSTASTHHSSPEGIYDSPPASASLSYMPSMQPFRNDNEVFYHAVPELETFDFSGSASTSSSDASLANSTLQSMASFSDQHESYLDPSVFATGGSVIGSPAEDGCPQYEQACNGYYQ